MTKRSAVILLPRTPVILTAIFSFNVAIAIHPNMLQAASNSSDNRPAVEVNLEAIASNSSKSNLEQNTRSPKRFVYGREVIILTPPSLLVKQAPEKIVLPRKKPPQSALAMEAKEKPAAPAVTEVETKSPVDAAKVAAVDIKEKISEIPIAEEKTPSLAAPKVEAIIVPAADEQVSLPSKEEVTATEKEVTEAAADKVAGQDDEIKVAAIDPQSEMNDAAKETAATAEALEEGELLSLQYSTGEVDMPETAGPKIQSLYEQLEFDQRTVQLIAYATANNNSAARRLSLGRALAVRSRLLELGMNNKRIEVRALGMPNGEAPSDRVDLVLIAR